MRLHNQSFLGRIFDVSNYLFLGIVAGVMVFPLVYVAVGSFSSTGLLGGFNEFSLDAYRFTFSTNVLALSTLNSVVITVFGTAINMVLTTITAYALSKKYLRGRGIFLKIIVMFMLFSPGIIPNYLVVSRLRLINTFWALWLPTAISAYNLIIMKNFFQQLPESIEESAKIDGCNDFMVFILIVLPVSQAALATITLFYAVAHWNAYFSAMMYINSISRWPIQVWLRQIIILAIGGFAGTENMSEFASVPSDSVRYAVIMISTIPIIIFYPFLQKYFAKGVLLGSVKG